MNSGDEFEYPGAVYFLLKSLHAFRLDDEYPIFYGKSRWFNNTNPGLPIKLNKIIPRFGRVPSHQAMIIPTSVQRKLGFDPNFSVAADKDFKIRAILSGVKFVYIDEVVCISKAGGSSQIIKNHDHLFYRTKEVFYVMKKNYSYSWGVVVASLFYFWNLRKLFSTKNIHNI